MTKSEDIKMFLQLKAIEEGFKLIESENSFTMIFNDLSKIEIRKKPKNREEWETHLLYLEKPISKNIAGKPLLFSAHDLIEKNKSKEIIRLSFGLFLNSGEPTYKQYIYYKNGKNIVNPKQDYFEELIIKGKLVDTGKKNLIPSELKAFHPYIESAFRDYQNEINLKVLKEQKKWTMKYLDELYTPGNKNNVVFLGMRDERISNMIDQSETELLNKKREIREGFKLRIMLKILSVGYISTNEILYRI